ncbi:RHS repeat-associated core domain-containing protein [Pseudomonas sp. KFB-139]|uniref:RHS repeat-associated core domain-containing protein n=1 Tax=Pseudomonas serbiensis TaxID=3064350 RepID=A0ABT9CII1_9PSED|nr:RHS repeat-associated core domain-containing protein [Pseudomonas sp. KFB-138]MDO7925284.1 RHS repeat-associated core domain-containing protein [Pseudomonas sp. KFB-138]
MALAVVTLSDRALAVATDYSYTSLGQLETVNGPRTDLNDITRFTYDAQGNLASVTNALGHVTRLTSYDLQGNPQKITDPNGAVTTLSYTTNGLLASTTLGSSTTRFDYNAVGDVIKVTGGNGNWVEYSYDSARRLTGVRNILGESLTYTLDKMGNRTAEVTKNSSGTVVRQQRRAFDELGRLVQVVGAANQTRRYSYDLNDNLSTDTSARSNKTQQSFDALNRVIKIVDPLQGSTSLAYNADDRVTQVVDPRGVTTQYAYDGQGNLLKTVSPDTGTSAFVYDEANNLIRSTDARGVVTEYTYDALNRLITKSYPSTPALNVKFLYDQATGGNYGIGRRTGIQDSAGLLSYSYDVQGKLAGQQRSVAVNSGSYNETLTYGYDAAGNLVKMGYPSSIGVTYTRNTAGQVAGIQLTVAGKTVTLASNIAYQPFGPVRTLTWGNGILLSKTYDQDYQLTQQQVGNWQTTYGYDADSNISSTTNSLWGAVQYEYDALSRLTQEQNSTIKKAYTLDATGNRTRRTTSNLASSSTTETQTLVYASDSNRLTSINGATAPVDVSGNHTQVNGLRLTYDSQGRLSQVHQASIYQIAEYKYNALGQRVSKRVYEMGSQALIGTTTYLYDPNGKLIGQTFYDANGLKTSGQYWFWLDDMPLAQLTANFSSLGEVSSSKLVYLHSDHLNTPRLATDSTQALQWRWNSDAYGVGKPDEDVDGDGVATSVALRFPGQIYDAQTQLNYNYYRDYNPETGRYVQSDPIGLEGGINTYGYTGGNPIRFFDSTGTTPIAGGVVGAELGTLVLPGLGTVVGGGIGLIATFVLADQIAQWTKSESTDGPALPIDLPDKIPDFDFEKPEQCPVDSDGVAWPWKGQLPQGGSKGGYKNPNGPESLHPDLDHGGDIGAHWDFNDRASGGYRIGPDGTITPK